MDSDAGRRRDVRFEGHHQATYFDTLTVAPADAVFPDASVQLTVTVEIRPVPLPDRSARSRTV